jgi:hypothetical protein
MHIHLYVWFWPIIHRILLALKRILQTNCIYAVYIWFWPTLHRMLIASSAIFLQGAIYFSDIHTHTQSAIK